MVCMEILTSVGVKKPSKTQHSQSHRNLRRAGHLENTREGNKTIFFPQFHWESVLVLFLLAQRGQ